MGAHGVISETIPGDRSGIHHQISKGEETMNEYTMELVDRFAALLEENI